MDKRDDPVNNLRQTYFTYTELMRNPKKMGYLNLYRKIRGQSKIPINISLFDFRQEIDIEIRDINRRLRRKVGLDILPKHML